MKIKKEELRQALEIVKPGLANKEIIEQSTHFAFINNRVVTYNDEISISHPVPGLNINGAVRAEELYKLLGKLKKDEIEVEIVDNEVILTTGKSKAGLRLQEKITLPLEEIKEQNDWKPLPDKFLEAVKFTLNSCSNDMSRPIMTCIHTTDSFVEGSDGFRISKYMVKKIPVVDLLIPASSMRELLKVKPTQIAVGTGWTHFRTDQDTIFSCRVFSDTYPDTTVHLKIEGSEIVFPSTINEILDKASVFSKREHFNDESVMVELEKGKVKIRGESEIGWFEEETHAKYSGDKVQFNITPDLLKNILTQTNTCILSKNKIKFTGENWEYVALLKG